MNILQKLFRRSLFLAATRVKFRDVAFQYRMGAGSPGDVTRTHPASIEPCLIDPAAPPTAFGQPVVAGANNGVRRLAAGDTALTTVYGFTVRPYPFQPDAATNYGAVGFGNGSPPLNQPLDVLKLGSILTKLGGAGVPTKGGSVFVWIAVDSGSHVQGQVETSATGGSTIALPSTITFNGPADADGVVELVVRA